MTGSTPLVFLSSPSLLVLVLALSCMPAAAPRAQTRGTVSTMSADGAAGAPGGSAGNGDVEMAGLRMLARAHEAAQSLAYSGIYVHQRGAEVRSRRIAHQRVAGLVHEKIQNLDGTPSESVRRGDRVQTFFPEQRRIFVRDHEPVPSFPALRALDAQGLTARYRLRWLGDELVAGRPSSAWALEPRDALRYGYRFWADKASGLLLRAQTISEKAEVVEQAAFSQLVTGPLPLARLAASIRDTRGWRTEDASGHPASPAAAAAWHAGWLPPGFAPAGAWVRKLGSGDHRGESHREVLQLLYSDGMAGVSVFVEPWPADRSARPLQLGAVNMVGKRYGKFSLTIVGEAPMPVVRQIADGIEFNENARR